MSMFLRTRPGASYECLDPIRWDSPCRLTQRTSCFISFKPAMYSASRRSARLKERILFPLSVVLCAYPPTQLVSCLREGQRE
jgi:hypothetical protein